MNNELYEIIKVHKFHPKSYQKIRNVYVIDDHDKRLVIKLNTNNYDIYKYLISRDFHCFPDNYNKINDNYEISLYIDDLSVSKEQKISDYLSVLAILHYKTSYKREIDLDEIKEEYERLTSEIKHLQDYYYNLNNIIDKELFLSPPEYLLVRNISLIYQVLDKSLILLNEVYDKIKNQKTIRVSLLHNNIDLDHLIINNQKYLISWDKSSFQSPIYELEKFYRKYYSKIEINDLFKIYESINKLYDNEKKMLLVILSIPKEIHLTNDTYLDTKKINNEITYLNKIYELLEKVSNN